MGLSTIEDYTTLKHLLTASRACLSLSTIEDYTTLKRRSWQPMDVESLSTIEDYTTLKPQILKFEETASTTMR